MAREGKVIVKILKDVCSPIPYMGHSHERSLVHLLNPCSDINRKDIQCNTFSFDYYEEGDNLVFKVKDNPTIVGYNVSREFTVVYWSSQDNNYVHTQGDGNGGNFNRSGFFQKEGDYYVGKVNKDWFLRTFDLKEIAIRIAYFDLDNHEEELIYCYSEKKNSNDYTKNKVFVKCSPFIVVTNKQHQPTGWSFDAVLQPRATVPANTTTKYFFDYTVNDVWQGEELVQTNTTGGELHNFTKSIFTTQESGIVKVKFKIELPPEVDTGGDRTCYFEIPVELKDNKPTIHCNPTITYEKELNENYVLYKLKLNPNDTSTNFIAGKNVYYFVKSYFDGVNQGESLVYKHDTGGILPIRDNYIYVHNKTVKKVKIEFRIEYPSDYYEVDKRVCDYTIEDDDVWGQNIENSFNCDRATMSGTPFNCDQTYDTGLSSFADIIKNNYEVIPKVYYSPDGGTNWEIYEEGSQSLSGGEGTDYVYRGCIQKKFGILRYKFGVELKNKKTGVISDKKCYVEFMLEDTVQEQSHCYSITVSEREANEEVKYKGDIYINMYRGYDVLPSYKIKTYYRYYDETDYKELSETTIDMTTYVDNTVAYTAFVQNPRDKYYLKAELIRPDIGYVICETEENLIRKE